MCLLLFSMLSPLRVFELRLLRWKSRKSVFDVDFLTIFEAKMFWNIDDSKEVESPSDSDLGDDSKRIVSR